MPDVPEYQNPVLNFQPPATEYEVRAASLQFVRKISGFDKPSKANEPAFPAAIDEVTGISMRLLRSLETTALVHDLTVATRNVDHFQSTGVSVLNPWQS